MLANASVWWDLEYMCLAPVKYDMFRWHERHSFMYQLKAWPSEEQEK